MIFDLAFLVIANKLCFSTLSKITLQVFSQASRFIPIKIQLYFALILAIWLLFVLPSIASFSKLELLIMLIGILHLNNLF